MGLIGTKTPAGSILRVNLLQKFLVARPSVDLHAEFYCHPIGDLCGHGAAKGGIEIAHLWHSRDLGEGMCRGSYYTGDISP